jgi:transposase InsO family protein
VREFTDFFTKKGTNLWFSQPSQPHKNAIIECFWRTLAQLLQRIREGTQNFDWVKTLPDVVENYNETYHRVLKAKPTEVLKKSLEIIIKHLFQIFHNCLLLMFVIALQEIYRE